jgi:integrase
LMPPADSKLWRPGYHLLAKTRALGLETARQDLLSLNRSINNNTRDVTPPDLAKNYKDRLFAGVAREWFENNSRRWVPTYAMRLKVRLEEDLIARLGKRELSKITALELLSAVREIEKRGAIETAKRILHMAGAIFRYGVATGRCSRDISADLRGALQPARKVKHMNSLSAKELPEFLKTLGEYDGDILTKVGLRVLILTFVRMSELRFARWAEFEDLDGKQPLWRIPAERMKMRRPHLVPLAPQAVQLIKSLHRKASKSPFLFAANTVSGVLSENTIIYAIYRMGYHNRATAHGFRSTASTILNEAEFNRDWIEAHLAHLDRGVRGVYNSAQWLTGRREMMRWWANYIDRKQRG